MLEISFARFKASMAIFSDETTVSRRFCRRASESMVRVDVEGENVAAGRPQGRIRTLNIEMSGNRYSASGKQSHSRKRPQLTAAILTIDPPSETLSSESWDEGEDQLTRSTAEGDPIHIRWSEAVDGLEMSGSDTALGWWY